MAETFQPNDTRPTCSETLGSFAANLRYEALPAAAIRRLQILRCLHRWKRPARMARLRIRNDAASGKLSPGRVESIDGVATPLHPRAHPSEPCITAPCTDVVEPLLRLGETVLRDETRRYHGLRITHAAQYRIHLAVQLQGGIRGIRWQRAIVVADCSRREPVEPC